MQKLSCFWDPECARPGDLSDSEVAVLSAGAAGCAMVSASSKASSKLRIAFLHNFTKLLFREKLAAELLYLESLNTEPHNQDLTVGSLDVMCAAYHGASSCANTHLSSCE